MLHFVSVILKDVFEQGRDYEWPRRLVEDGSDFSEQIRFKAGL